MCTRVCVCVFPSKFSKMENLPTDDLQYYSYRNPCLRMSLSQDPYLNSPIWILFISESYVFCMITGSLYKKDQNISPIKEVREPKTQWEDKSLDHRGKH